jgi:acyl-CoA thioesterase
MLTFSDVEQAFTLEPLEGNRFRVPNLNYYASGTSAATGPIGDVIAGGQLLSQAILAASILEPAKRVKTIHISFPRSGKVSEQLNLEMPTVQSGRTFATLSFSFSQMDKQISTGSVLMDAPDPDFVRHAQPMPEVDKPTGSPAGNRPGGQEIEIPPSYADRDGPNDVSPPELATWYRYPDAPDDEAMSQALIAFATNFPTIGIALQPHEDVDRRHKSHDHLPRTDSGERVAPVSPAGAIRGTGAGLRARQRLYRGRRTRRVVRAGCADPGIR